MFSVPSAAARGLRCRDADATSTCGAASAPATRRGPEAEMKGNKKLLTVLNQLLADELTAISQYMVHSEMCDNWGYEKLHKAIEGQAMDEMHHAEWLIQRIVFLDGAPVVSKLNPIRIGKDVPAMIGTDQEDEVGAIQSYNAAIRIGHEVDDQGTVELLTKILKMEEGHEDWAEAQRDQIAQMGLENYLVNQVEAAG
jgi:bacterioferritin